MPETYQIEYFTSYCRDNAKVGENCLCFDISNTALMKKIS